MFGSKEVKKILYFAVFCGFLLGKNLHVWKKVDETPCFAVFFQSLGFQSLGRGRTIKDLFFCVFSNCRELPRTTTCVVEP